ncbi:hypothetical protein AB0425_25615 [Actinosynnema sp. NPDC051121]
MRKAMSVIAMSAVTLTLAAAGAGATTTPDVGAQSGTCYVAGAFCGTSDSVSGQPLTLTCGQVKSMPWSGGGYWNNRLPNNGVVRMADASGWVIYNTPPNYGPVRGNWTPVYSLRADCG